MFAHLFDWYERSQGSELREKLGSQALPLDFTLAPALKLDRPNPSFPLVLIINFYSTLPSALILGSFWMSLHGYLRYFPGKSFFCKGEIITRHNLLGTYVMPIFWPEWLCKLLVFVMKSSYKSVSLFRLLKQRYNFLLMKCLPRWTLFHDKVSFLLPSRSRSKLQRLGSKGPSGIFLLENAYVRYIIRIPLCWLLLDKSVILLASSNVLIRV